MWLAIGWLACNGSDDGPPSPAQILTGGPEIPVQVLVDGDVVFDGLANAPESGLYQPPGPGAVCSPSRRIGLFKGSDVYLEVLFPGEMPVAGSEVVFPSSVDQAAGDWNVAGWRGEDDATFAAYGGVATLVSFGADGAEVSIAGATVCGSDRLGSLDEPEGLWRDHTTDCADAGATVVFRTLEPAPWDVTKTWCAAGRVGSWQTPSGEPLCSVERLPCDVTPE